MIRSASPRRLAAAASTLAVVSASEPASSGSDTSTALAAPIASAVRSPDISPFGAIDTRLTSPPPAVVDELQRHLDAVAVGLVEDQLAVTLERVVRGIQLARLRRIGDLLDADDHVHGALIVTDDLRFPQSRRPRSPIPAPRRAAGTVVRLADPAGRELVRVVGDGPQHRRRAPPAEPRPRRRARRDQPPRPRHPLRPRRRPARRRRGRRLRRRRHAQRGGDRHRRHRHRARRAARRVDERVRPHDRAAQRPGRRRRAARRRHRRRRLPPDRARPGQRAVLLLPHRRRLRRRGRRGGRAAGVAEALARPPAVHHRRRSRRGSAATTAGTRTSGSRPTERVVDDGYFSIVLNTNPYTYLGNRPLDLSHAATLDRGLVVVTFRTMRARTILALARRRAARRRRRAERPRRRADRPRPPRDRARDAVPVPARRRLPRRDRPPRVPPRPRRRPAGLPRWSARSEIRSLRARSAAASDSAERSTCDPSARAPRLGVARRGRRRIDVGDVGDDAVDAATARATSAQRVVARPGVDEEAGVVAALDLLGGDGRLPRVHARCGRAPRRRRRSSASTSERQPRRRHASDRAAGSGRRWPAGTTRSASARRRARRASASTSTATRSSRIEVGLARVVLDLDVDPQRRRRRRAPRRASARTPAAPATASSTMTRPSLTRASWWTTRTPSAVRRTSSSTPSAPTIDGQLERRDRVLRAPAATRPGGR